MKKIETNNVESDDNKNIKKNKSNFLKITLIVLSIIILIILIYIIGEIRKNKQIDIEGYTSFNIVNNIEISPNKKDDAIVAAVDEEKEEKIYGYDENAMQVESEYNGYPACGFIEIYKIGLAMPILSIQTAASMEYSCSRVYNTGNLNLSGLNYITGHNYDNGRLFSNIKKLSVGDKIVVTGLYKNRLEYTIYNIFNTTPDDTEYLTKKVDEKNIEIALQCCNNDPDDTRFIIQAVHKIKQLKKIK